MSLVAWCPASLRSAPLLALWLGLALLAPAAADPTPPPRLTWTVGQWWELAVERRVVRLGAQQPDFPAPSSSAPLDGLALSGPRGEFLEVARWRFQVVASRAVKSEAGLPEPLYVVEARRLDEHRDPVVVTLEFQGEAKRLAGYTVQRGERRDGPYRRRGQALVLPDTILDLCDLPLVWPDLRPLPAAGAAAPRREIYNEDGVRLRQRVDRNPTGTYVLLQRADGTEPALRFRFRPDEPWFQSMKSPHCELRLIRCGGS